ncbi:MAG: ABC transporter permease [Clostridia bacterium]|jgi:spermidine/putrescine transport system permease protein|nr:ABC transporter permease [Clostridia bacterium]MBQ1963697.1 ABC transporter permease [Clostridia bacterium]
MKKRSVFERMAEAPYLVWSAMFILAPLLFVAYFAFTDRNGSFTLENITSLSAYSNTFVMSLGFALIATAICLLIGYPLAYCMSRTSERTRNILTVLLMLPMWISLLIRTYSLMALLDNGGLVSSFLVGLGLPKLTFIGTEGAVILGMVYDFLPYMVLPIYTSMNKLDKRYIEAAADLGCNSRKTLFRVILPLTMPGIISGVTMVFVPSISTFYISQKLGGGSFDLIGDTIERQFQNAVTYHTGAAISLVMMILIFISLAVMNKFSDGGEDIIV